jgi:hypothetical protein
MCFSGVFAQSIDQKTAALRLDSLHNQKNTIRLQEKLVQLSKSSNENDLILLDQYYSVTKQSDKAQALVTAAVRKFPNGKYAISSERNKVISESDPLKKEQMLTEMLNGKSAYISENNQDYLQYDFANSLAKNKNPDKALEAYNKINAVLLYAKVLYKEKKFDEGYKYAGDFG